VSPSGIEPATFRLVAQCLNRLLHLVLFSRVSMCVLLEYHWLGSLYAEWSKSPSICQFFSYLLNLTEAVRSEILCVQRTTLDTLIPFNKLTGILVSTNECFWFTVFKVGLCSKCFPWVIFPVSRREFVVWIRRQVPQDPIRCAVCVQTPNLKRNRRCFNLP
jgi:hypothetical protein